MPSPMSSARLLMLAAALSSCAAQTPQPPPPVSPREVSRPLLPAPPWQARVSVADGHEAPPPAEPAVLIRGATLMIGTGQVVPRGSILLQGGKIAAVTEGDLAPPGGAVIIDGAGRFVTPGIIDAHSHLGVYPMPGGTGHADGNEMTDPVTPEAQSIDAFWPQDPGIERAVAGGVTTIQVLPGSGNLIGGRAVTLKLRPAPSPRQMHVPGAPDGLKMACGENPKRFYGEHKRSPMTRMGNLALQRAAFLKAKKLQADWARWGEAESRRIMGEAKGRAAVAARREERARQQAWCAEDPARAPCAKWREGWAGRLEDPEPSAPIPGPDRSPGLETLVAVLEGRVLVHVHCYRADDMFAILTLADEVGFQVRSFHHALEAYKIRGELAARGVSVSTWADWWGFKLEAYDGIPENAALVHESGGRAVIHSDSAEDIQRLNQEASKALASGRRAGVQLTDGDAIRWITLNAAWTLGIDHRTGSLEVGKDADVVLWSKNPLSVYATAEKVWIDGALVRAVGDDTHATQGAHERGRSGAWSDFELGQDAATPPPALLPPAGGGGAQ